MLLFMISFLIFSLSILLTAALGSFSAPIKFAPLPDGIFFTFHWMNFKIHRISKSKKKS